MDRKTKSLLKQAESNKPSKYDLLKAEFESYKNHNDVKIKAITDLRKENASLKSGLEQVNQTYLQGQPGSNGEVSMEIEDTAAIMNQVAVDALEKYSK